MAHSLDDILRNTLLLTAWPNLQTVVSFKVPRIEQLSAEELSRIDNEKLIQQKRIWQYELDGLTRIKQLTARHRQFGDRQLAVCDRVEWGPVKIVSKGQSFDLPLMKDYLLRTYFVFDGRIPAANSGLWQLPMNVHSSFMHVFGYEMNPATGRLQPLRRELLTNSDLMAPVGRNALERPVSISVGKTLKVYVTPLRVVVCIVLACAGERTDFEPGGILGAARLIPHVMVQANLPLDSTEAAVEVARPSLASMCHMDGEEMSESIAAGLYTDRNERLIPPSAYWDKIFDYYLIDPPPGTSFAAVKSESSTREIAGGSETWDFENGYVPRTIKKLAGQGEFDNLHLAPKMVAPEGARRLHPEWGLDQISMAPFCVHDCLHTHWRWGGEQESKWVRGWSGTADSIGEPYAKVGAPQVPPNQDVSITLLGASGFRYQAIAYKPKPGQWQVFMHHGSAYAVSIESSLKSRGLSALARLQSNVDDIGQGFSLLPPWSMFYWSLRYEIVHEKPPTLRERIRISPETLSRGRFL